MRPEYLCLLLRGHADIAKMLIECGEVAATQLVAALILIVPNALLTFSANFL